MIKYAPAPTQRAPSSPATAEDINYKRRMALSMMQDATSAAPVGHWTQALARAAQGAVGGMYASQAATEGKARETYDTQQSAAQRMAANEQEFQEKRRWDEYQRTREPTEAEKLEMDYKRAQAEKLRRDAASGGEAPSNVREWQHFNNLSPEDQQRYLTMKRAEKYLDTGTEFVRPNPVQPGANVNTVPKNVAEEQRLKKAGEAAGTAGADLPRALAAGERMLEQIQGVQNDPNLPNVTGWQGFLPTLNPRNVDTEERIAQLGGGAFLQAFESLKGGGQITEIEGKKATDALARLTNLRQSDSGFLQALNDFQAEVVRLQTLAKQRAGGGLAVQPSAGGGGPPVGAVQDGYRFKGGNPGDPNSWERM